jgi:zinc transport system substrate-binding protein
MKKIFFLMIITILSLSLTGCVSNENQENINVVTTIYPLSEFAKEIGQDKVKVTMLLPPGAEAHTYDPRPSDIIKVNNADLFIYIGEEMESWSKKILKSAKDDLNAIEAVEFVKNVIEDEHHDEELIKEIDHIIHEWEENDISSDEAMHEIEELVHKFLKHEPNEEHEDEHHDEELIKEIDHIIHEWEENDISSDEAMHEIEELVHKFLKHEPNEEHEEDHHEHEYDPHIWLDFNNNIDIVNEITNRLSEIDNENADFYKNNAQTYILKLENLHNLYETTLQNCDNRIILSAGHNIYAYLENKYNFESVTAHGLSPDSEPTPLRIKEIIDLSKEHNLNYIFFEELVNPRLAESIANDASLETLVFNPAANIAKNQEGKTFIDIMQSNLDNLKKAMDCN